MDLAVAVHAQGRAEAATTFLRQAHELFGVLGVPSYVRRAKELAGDLAIVL